MTEFIFFGFGIYCYHIVIAWRKAYGKEKDEES